MKNIELINRYAKSAFSRLLHTLTLCVLVLSSMSAYADVYPSLSIRGENYGLLPLEQGQQPFFNRTNMSLREIPTDYAGWQFVKINANSSYIPGPLPVYEVMAEEDGYIMAMMATADTPEVCSAWAEANGWELVEGPTVAYADGEKAVMTFYRKAVTAGEWINIVQPETFSGALLIAPSITDYAERDVYPELIIRGENYELKPFENGQVVFSNREMTFSGAPGEFAGWQFTKINANSSYRPGPKASFEVKAKEDGYIMVMVEIQASPEASNAWIEANGWEVVEGYSVSYTTNLGTMTFFRKPIKAGEWVNIVQPEIFSGAVLIAPSIKEPTPEVYPVLSIRGENYGVLPLEQGQQPFYNRDNMPLREIPEDYVGWQFVKINANSSFKPGPLASYEVMVEEDGYIMAMMATAATPDVCSAWAETNGWELVEGPTVSYADGETGVMTFYRKEMKAGEWVNIVQPETFSGALLIAPSITDKAERDVYPELSIRGENYELKPFENGQVVFSNREMTFSGVPGEFAGWQFTKINANSSTRPGPLASFEVKSEEDGYIMTMVATEATPDVCNAWAEANGWEVVEGYSVSYTTTLGTMTFFRKPIKAGEWVNIVQPETFSGAVLIAPSITESPVEVYPALSIRGKNFGILPLEQGQKPFFNRDNMALREIPEDYADWQFVKINANSSYWPGPLPEYEVKAEEDGYIMAMMATADTPDVCSAWAEANGWELVEGPTVAYGDGEKAVMTFYRKEIKAGEWVNIVQPETFSGALLIAPSVTEIPLEVYPALSIRGEHYAVTPFEQGQQPFLNRSNMPFNEIPEAYDGWQFVKINANSSYWPGPLPAYEVKVEEDGYIMVMVATEENPDVCSAWAEANGWDVYDGPAVSYAAEKGALTTYRKAVKAGEWVNIVQPETFSGALLIAPSITDLAVPDVYPTLTIRGTSYSVSSFEKGQVVFLNREMAFGDIPGEFAGWQFTKINANSTYRPGPLASIEVLAEEDGYLMSMVATEEKPEVCSAWAEANGWEIVEGYSVSYTTEKGTMTFFRKPVKAGEWVNVVQPETFSGAVVIAPSIKGEDDDDEQLKAVPVDISALGWMEVGDFEEGSPAFANRGYILCGVKKAVSGLKFTRYNGGQAPIINVTAREAGDMYIAVSETENTFKPEENGWAEVPGAGFYYNDGTSTSFKVYTKSVTEGEQIEINTDNWTGVFVLSSDITFETVIDILPPPGVVIHNSKAATLKYVGSPSITVLEDGTYLASHDIFGGVISYSYVYESKDKGQTWTEISKIDPLNWSKLFTHNGKLYLIGVAPKCTMGYGDIVVLRSDDNGHTWTKPVDGKTGLLRSGYYHTAPTPVVFHNGRIWKAMEEQGEAYWGWGPFSSFVLSAAEDADLLDVDSWTFTNKLEHRNDIIGSTAWLEGNVVVAPDGSVKNILRMAYNGDDKAALVNISDDGTEAKFNPLKNIIDLPGAGKKFTIRYDSISAKYWTLSNYVLSEDRVNNSNLGGTRNTIVLAYSEDLRNWTIKDTLLHHSDVAYHGFQYLDWQFEGDDIIAVSRTAWEDETGNANSQHNANYLTFHRFHNFRYDRANSEMGVKVYKWRGNAESAFTLTFDDGFKAHYDYAYPMLEKYGLKGTFYVNTSNLVAKGQTPIQRYGFEEEFREMSDAGHEIGSHSLTHPNLTSLDITTLKKELGQDKANIERFTGKQCLTHAYPYCIHNETVDRTMASYFIAGRTGGNVYNDIPTSQNGWYSTNSELVTWKYPRSLEFEQESFEEMKAKIDNLNGRFGVVCIHETLPFDLLSTSDTYEVATTEWLENMCSYLSELRDDGKVWTAPLADLVRYAEEKRNLRVAKHDITEDSILYEFTTWLDTTIYNVPLTMEIAAPTGWKTMRCQIISDGNVISEKIYSVTDESIILDVVPDKETVLLIGEEPDAIGSVDSGNTLKAGYDATRKVVYVKNVDSDVVCEIFNVMGNVVKSAKCGASSNSEIDVATMASGVYIVRFSTLDKKNLSSFSFAKCR